MIQKQDTDARYRSNKQKSEQYACLKYQAALLGRELQRQSRASDGRIGYVVTHRGQSHYFSHLHDVHGHLEPGVRFFPHASASIIQSAIVDQGGAA